MKQNSWGVEKIWWVPILTRGKLHVDLLPSTFPGEKPEGVHEVVGKIPGALNARFPNAQKPRVVMTDRGPGFYHASTGRMTGEYGAALAKHGLRAHMGDDASMQAGDSQDLMLHETAVAWLRNRLALTLPRRPWLETREQFSARLKAQAAYVNKHYCVAALCREFPGRLDDVIAKGGDRIWK